jgi:hypothetical protein
VVVAVAAAVSEAAVWVEDVVEREAVPAALLLMPKVS